MRFPLLAIPLSLALLASCVKKDAPPTATTVEEPPKPFEVLSGKIEPNPFSAGQQVTVTLSVKSSERREVMLGANLSSGEKPYYDLEREGNRTVALKPGTHDYSFLAKVDKTAPEGNFALRAAIWQDNNHDGTIGSATSKPDHDTILWGPQVLRGAMKCFGVAKSTH